MVLYCLALAAHRFGVELHALAFLSNHDHLLATDRKGQLPLFMHCLDVLVARALNARHGRLDAFWASSPYGWVAHAAAPFAGLELRAPQSPSPLAHVGRSWSTGGYLRG
jgi:hypothetical protein